MTPCPVCTIPLASRETCPSPSCPCYGLDARSAEAAAAALAYRTRPSVAQARTLRSLLASPETRTLAGDEAMAIIIEFEHG